MTSTRCNERLRLALIALAFALLLPFVAVAEQATPVPASPEAATPVAVPQGDTDPQLYAAIQPDYRDAIYARTAGWLSRYRVSAELLPAGPEGWPVITGTLDLRWVNATGKTQRTLPFRLYANDPQHGEGATAIGRASSGGKKLKVTFSDDQTTARVRLPRTVDPGEAIDLTISFTTTIPTNPQGTYRMFAYDSPSDSYSLAHWMPLISTWLPGEGWHEDPPSTNGDTILSETALFDLMLTAPNALTIAATGETIARTPAAGDRTTQHIITGPVRDLVLSASSAWQTSSRLVEGVMITSYYYPGMDVNGVKVIDFTASTIELYNPLLGAYPYREVDIVAFPLGRFAGGVEFPAFFFVSDNFYPEDSVAASVTDFLEFVVVHEMLHQWFYALVGNDHYDHAFLDEGLCNYLTVYYFERVYGPDEAYRQTVLNLLHPYLNMLFSTGDLIVDTPTAEFAGPAPYAATVYGKGGLGFGAIHDALGDEAFFGALADYVDEAMFALATPEQLRSHFVAADPRMAETWRHWFNAAEGTQDFTVEDLREVNAYLGF